jgi:hypothetical protein
MCEIFCLTDPTTADTPAPLGWRVAANQRLEETENGKSRSDKTL